MSHITIPNVDDHTVQGLKQMAWQNGVSLDESLRRLLRDAVAQRRAMSYRGNGAESRFMEPLVTD
jgi:plasmid stability protein